MQSTQWHELAKTLRIGQTRKIKHCGNDRSALVSNTDRGYTFHCFRCGASYYEPHGERGLKEIMATRRAEEAIGETVSMPADAVALMEGPPSTHRWVLDGGLIPEVANDDYGFRWSPSLNRVLIPFPGGILGRSVDGARPKYRLYGRPGCYALDGPRSRPTVVVEDILSAIAVNRAGWPAVAILGTSITPGMMTAIAQPHVIGWFDDDYAGAMAFTKLRRALALWPTTLGRVITPDDPKHCHRALITARLEGCQ